MTLYTHFLRNLVLPVGSRLAGYGDVMPTLQTLEDSQWWSTDRLQALQNQKLRRLIAHVYLHVPFYHDLMVGRGLSPTDFRTTDDLVKLPIVDKYVIRDHFPDDPPRPVYPPVPARSTLLPAAPQPNACTIGPPKNRKLANGRVFFAGGK